MITAPQRPVDPPAGFQQAREERTDPQLRDPQLDITRRGRQQTGPGPVALVGPCLGPLVGLGTDRRAERSVNQVLHPPFEQPAEQVLAVTITETADQVGNSGIIVMGHRVVPSQ